MAWGVGRGDAVFVPSFTFAATAEIVPWFDAEPVFIDVDETTYNMDPGHLEAAIEATLKEGRLKPRVVIAVDLFGQPADYPAIKAICDKHGLKLISDSAQGFGCTIDGGASAEMGRHHHDQLLPGQAAGLLRRRRGGADQ